MIRPITFVLSATLALGATSAFAEAHGDALAAIETRQEHMKLYGAQLRTLGGMARGDMEYNAEQAAAAAAELATLAAVDQSGFWPEGSDNVTVPEENRALPAIWENADDFEAKRVALIDASAALALVAGDGMEALGGGMGAVGGSCGACHETYRAPDE